MPAYGEAAHFHEVDSHEWLNEEGMGKASNALARTNKIEKHPGRSFQSVVKHSGDNQKGANGFYGNRFGRSTHVGSKYVFNIAPEKLDKKSTLKKWRKNPEALMGWVSSHDHSWCHQKVLARHQDGTCRWIVKEIRDWLLGEQKVQYLWCSGIAGCGKTVSTAVAIDTAQDIAKQTHSPVLYFYCEYKFPETLTTSFMLASLLKQLLIYMQQRKHLLTPDIENKLLELYTIGRQHLHFTESFDLLTSLLKRYPGTVICFDALDECPSDTVFEILGFARILSPSSESTAVETSVTKVFISSLTIVDVRDGLHPEPCRHVHITSDKINYDISMYVAAEVERSRISSDPSIVKEIKETLVLYADGMFLWVRLQIAALREDCISDDEVLAALKRLPRDLEATYVRCLERMQRISKDDLSLAGQVLKWTSSAIRPLTMEELKEAVSLKPTDITWKPNTISSEKLIRICGNLVVLDEEDGSVSLAHRSVKQFLFLSSREDQFDLLKFDDRRVQLELGDWCIRYLLFDNFGLSLERYAAYEVNNIPPPVNIAQTVLQNLPGSTLWLPWAKPLSSKPKARVIVRQENSSFSARFRLLQYARMYWAQHIRSIDQESPSWERFHYLARNPSRSWNLHPWVEDDSVEDGHNQALFEWAIQNDHGPLLKSLEITIGTLDMQKLCKRPANLKSYPLHYAAGAGYLGVLEALLPYFNVNEKEESKGETPIFWAIEQGQSHILQFLLARGKELQLQLPPSDQRLFMLAVASGNADSVRLLLPYLDPRLSYMVFNYAIIHETRFSHVGMVRHIMQSCAIPREIIVEAMNVARANKDAQVEYILNEIFDNML